MRALVVATTAAVACWLLLVVPAHAEAVPDPLAELVIAGAPLVASGPSPAAGGHDPGPPGPAAVSGSPSPPGAAPASPSGGAAPGDVHVPVPAVGFPSIPNPFSVGDALDPGAWAGALVDALVSTVGAALIEALRAFTDWALGLGGSSLNFVTRTPPAGSYDSATVHGLWDLSRAIANLALAVVVMWGGFNVMLRKHTGSLYPGVMELLPRVVLAALAANLSLEFARVLIDLNNGLCASIGQVGLPGYEHARFAQEGIAMLLVAIAYGVVALLLVLQMLTRLALLDLLIVLSPVMMLLWVLPQTQGWTRWWARLFGLTVFQQAVQMVALRLGSSLMVELTPGSASDALLTLLLGIAVCWLTLQVPSLLRGQVHHAGAGAVVSLVAVGRSAGSFAGRGGAAAGAAR